MSSQSDWTIRLENLTLGYDRHPVVHHLQGFISPGDMIALVGPNGAGKSTLIKAIIGKIAPLQGSISYENICAKKIAYLPQLSQIDVDFPVSYTHLTLPTICSV